MRKHFLHMRWKNILYTPLFMLLILMATTGVNALLPYISVDPPTATISAIGNTVTIAVNVTGVSDLYGYDVYVGYNSTLLQKTAAAVTGTGQVVPSDPSKYSFYDTSVSGTVRVSVAFLEAMGAQSFNGSGTLLWITFNGTALGQSPINIIDTDTYLYDHFAGTIDIVRPAGGEPPHCVITVIPEFPAAIATLLLLIATLAATFLGKIVWSRKR